jgi:hypothetical protein
VAEYFKHEIAKWNVATDDLTLEQEAAYHRAISQIRLYERPFRENYRVLAGLWRCNERKAKRLLEELVAAGKLHLEGGFIIDEKAVNDASTLRQLRIDRASAGRRGGIESGNTRRKSLENNETGEALASTREEKRREDIRSSRSSAQAREGEDVPDQPAEVIPQGQADEASIELYERVLAAVGLQSRGQLPAYWMPPSAIFHVARWRGLGLFDDEIVEVARQSRRKHPEPPGGPKALDRAMHITAGVKNLPKLEPKPAAGGGYERPATT